MFELSVIDSATGEVVERIQGAIDHVADFRPLWRRMRQPWHKSRREMYDTEGREFGWKSYQQTPERFRYVTVKSRLTGIEPDRLRVLRWKPGREYLYPSLVAARHPLGIWDAGKRAVTMGTAVPYAANHDAGRGRAPLWAGGYAIPRRRLVSFGRGFKDDLQKEVSKFAGEIAREFGRTTVGQTSAEVDL